MIRFHSDCSEVLLRNLFATVMRPRQTWHRTSRKLLMLRTLLEKRTVLTAPGRAVALAPPYFSSIGMLETNPPIQRHSTDSTIRIRRERITGSRARLGIPHDADAAVAPAAGGRGCTRDRPARALEYISGRQDSLCFRALLLTFFRDIRQC